HAFNARTHEVRYAFSPQDFGVVRSMSVTPEPMTPPRTRQRPSRSAAEVETDRIPASLEDVEAEEDMEPLETSLESLEEGRDDDEEDVFTLDDQQEDEDDEEDQDDDERDVDAEEDEV